jgi:hypothetical protein
MSINSLDVVSCHSLRVVQRFEAAGSAVTSITFSPEQLFIFVGTAMGQLLIYPLRKSIDR